MKFLISTVFLMGFLSIVIQAEPEPAKARRNLYQSAKFRSAGSDDDIDQMIAELRQAESVDTVNEKDIDDKTTKSDASSGRLFLRKFLLFRNIFSNSNTQPVIPIIITGAGNGATATTNPTTTITSTGSIPTATGTITTSPTTAAAATGAGRGPEDPEIDDEEEDIENAVALDEQTLQAALAAGAQEYVVTDDGKASKQPSRINLKRKGDKKGQTISVRIPPQYRRYFKNGQRVMLNTGNMPAKKRVVRRRVNKNRKRVNRNKNTNKRKRVVGF